MSAAAFALSVGHGGTNKPDEQERNYSQSAVNEARTKTKYEPECSGFK